MIEGALAVGDFFYGLAAGLGVGSDRSDKPFDIYADPFIDDDDISGANVMSAPPGGPAPQASYDATKVDQVNFYYNDPNHQKKTLFIKPEEIQKSHGFTPTEHSMEWQKSTVKTKMSWAGKNASVESTTGKSVTLQTQGEIDWGLVHVALYDSKGKLRRIEIVGVVVIEKATSATSLFSMPSVRRNTMVGLYR